MWRIRMVTVFGWAVMPPDQPTRRGWSAFRRWSNSGSKAIREGAAEFPAHKRAEKRRCLACLSGMLGSKSAIKIPQRKMRKCVAGVAHKCLRLLDKFSCPLPRRNPHRFAAQGGDDFSGAHHALRRYHSF